jgi:hypothetical protein
MLRFIINAAFMAWMATASTDFDRSLQGDFSWDITPDATYPKIGFDDASSNDEAQFKYTYTGTLVDNVKYLQAAVYQSDCSGAPGSGLVLNPYTPDTAAHALSLSVDIDQAHIADDANVYTEAGDGLSATIAFCVRVDYMYNDGSSTDSVNFNEQKVTITVDLTANFTLTSIATDRTAADQTNDNTNLDYPVTAFICDANSAEVVSPAALTQGDTLRFCVHVDDTVTTQDVYVHDILSATLTQPTGAGSATQIITASTPSAISAKDCQYDGICNIQTQLLSKYFTVANPGPLQVDGIAILSFGAAATQPPNRRLRVPIRGLISVEQVKAMIEARDLQQQTPDSANSPFSLEVPISATSDAQAEEPASNNNTAIIIGVVVGVLLLLAIGTGIYCYCKSKARQAEKEVHVSKYEAPVAYAENGGRPANGEHARVS